MCKSKGNFYKKKLDYTTPTNPHQKGKKQLKLIAYFCIEYWNKLLLMFLKHYCFVDFFQYY